MKRVIWIAMLGILSLILVACSPQASPEPVEVAIESVEVTIEPLEMTIDMTEYAFEPADLEGWDEY